MKYVVPDASKKCGRPLQYDRDYHIKITFRLASLGLTETDIAFVLDVSRQCLFTWKVQYAEFAESIQRGKALADDKVTRSLFKRATGYDKTEFLSEETLSGKCTNLVQTVMHYPADVKAIALWLRNRKVKLKSEMEMSYACAQE